MSEQADKIWHAVLSCPHTIMHDEIAIRVSHKRDGNAARQTYDRIETAINALIEEQAARIEQLEQKLRTTSLEALSISDTNNEMAVRIAELEDEDSKFEAEWTEARKGVNYFDMAHILSGRLRQMDKRAKAANKRADASQARLSEAVKVLEPFARYLDEHKFDIDNKGNLLPDETQPGWTYLNAGQFRAARQFLATLGEET